MTVDGGYGCGIAYISPHMDTNILVFGAKKRNIVISMHLNDKNIDECSEGDVSQIENN